MSQREALQHTIRNPVTLRGAGVHTGVMATLTLRPAPAGTGLVFRRIDLEPGRQAIPALIDHVTATAFATSLDNGLGASVQTSEHLLAACVGLGLDNAFLDLDGPEAPILDGSAEAFCRAIDEAGLSPQTAERSYIRILRTVTVQAGEAWARFEPREPLGLELSVEIDFDCAAIGRQVFSRVVSPDVFRSDIAFARTFARSKDLTTLSAAGLAKGASMKNGVLFDGDRVCNPEGLRADDECVRHKALDVVGDLALLGAPVWGRYVANRPGHTINALALRALCEQPDAFELTLAKTALAADAA
ncbi:MAG: UDP-3-O-acyl-N-acetylglucosamine deacetylase [Pseudomonadota bacterium]